MTTTKIKITYPENFALQGWDKSIFDLALKKVFSRGNFWDFDLTNLRRKVVAARAVQALNCAPGMDSDQDLPEDKSLLSDERAAEFAKDLSILSCIDFIDMNEETRQSLPGKISVYLGVKIEWKKLPASSLPATSNPYVFLAISLASLAAIAAIVAITVLVLSKASASHHSPSIGVYDPLALPGTPGALGLPGVSTAKAIAGPYNAFDENTYFRSKSKSELLSPPVAKDFSAEHDAEHDAERERSAPSTSCTGKEALCMSVLTPNPREFMQKLVASLPAPGVGTGTGTGNYSVVLNVVPLFDHQEDASLEWK